MSEECDLHKLTHEAFILLVATMHCNRDELRSEIKRVRQPTWIEIEAMVEELKIMTTVNTGCSVNLLALRIAKENKLTLTMQGLPRLVTATGADMTVNGQASITVSYGTELTQLNILVSSDQDSV